MPTKQPGDHGSLTLLGDMSLLEHEREQFAEQRRLAYIVVGIIGTLLLIYDMRVIAYTNHTQLGVYIINDMLFACAIACCVYLGYTRRLRIDLLERIVFWLLVAESFLFNALAPWFLQMSVERLLIETIADDVWLLVLVCTMAIQIFPQRRGLMWATGLYAISLASVGSYLVVRLQQGDNVALASVIGQAYVVGGMLLCLLYVLARYRDHVQRISLHTEMLEQLAYIDALTGLPNRRRMDMQAQAQIELARRYATPFCVALLDIDRFKHVNDTLGHLAGDLALMQVASVARSALRTTDLIGRWGGEEFLLLLPQTGLEEGHAAVERIRLAIEARAGDERLPITVSCGVTSYAGGDTTISLIQRADLALYRAKAGGRNQVASMAGFRQTMLEPAD
jgi:diguanylate cyclase (GGDEF)-like protein